MINTPWGFYILYIAKSQREINLYEKPNKKMCMFVRTDSLFVKKLGITWYCPHTGWYLLS